MDGIKTDGTAWAYETNCKIINKTGINTVQSNYTTGVFHRAFKQHFV